MQPHAVMRVSGGTISTTFTYDPNGNQTSGNGHTATWTSYNKPASITQGITTIGFLDGPDHQRFRQMTAHGTTLYMDGFGAHAELVMGSSWQWSDYLSVGNDPLTFTDPTGFSWLSPASAVCLLLLQVADVDQ